MSNLFLSTQTHYMQCDECDKEFKNRQGNNNNNNYNDNNNNRQGNKAALREAVARHKAAVHDVSASCPTCNKEFNHFNNKKANQNSMEQHQQVNLKIRYCVGKYQTLLLGSQAQELLMSALRSAEI